MSAELDMDAPRLVLRCVDGGGALTFALSRSPSHAATVTLELSDLRASRSICASPCGPLDLCGFLEECAGQWRGWEGEKLWSPMESEVVLTARHDRLGHIHVLVELNEFAASPWQVQGTITLEAGSLDALVRDAYRFEEALITAGRTLARHGHADSS